MLDQKSDARGVASSVLGAEDSSTDTKITYDKLFDLYVQVEEFLTGTFTHQDDLSSYSESFNKLKRIMHLHGLKTTDLNEKEEVICTAIFIRDIVAKKYGYKIDLLDTSVGCGCSPKGCYDLQRSAIKMEDLGRIKHVDPYNDRTAWHKACEKIIENNLEITSGDILSINSDIKFRNEDDAATVQSVSAAGIVSASSAQVNPLASTAISTGSNTCSTAKIATACAVGVIATALYFATKSVGSQR